MRPTSERRMPEILRKPIAERGPTILKSGVIDGMPYTLYADGSIEAQLPHGMVKFASVDALRAHLEKQADATSDSNKNAGPQGPAFCFGRLRRETLMQQCSPAGLF